MHTTAAVLTEPIDSERFSETRPAQIEELDIEGPTGEEVIVEITAASLCHTDVAIARGHIERQCPLVMGHEGAGIVHAVGEAVESVQVGDHVVLGRITCGRCEYCRAGLGQHCVKRTKAEPAGTLRTGEVRFNRPNGDPVHHCHGVSSFSEHTLVTEEGAIKIPDSLPPEHATLLGCGVFTGVGAAMNTVDIDAGSSVVVFGAGGVGLSTIQGARLCEASEIISVDIIPEKLDIAETVGATHTIDSSKEDVGNRVNEICDGGADFAFEVVGNERVAEQAVGVLTVTGTAVLVGVPPQGPRELSLDLFDMVISEKDIISSFNGSYTLPLAIPRLAELALSGKLLLEPLITDVKSLDEVNEAMEELETGSGIRKIIKS